MGKGKQNKDGRGVNEKVDDLAANTVEDEGEYLTTNQGVRVNDDQHTLKAGERGASLLEDFIFREKITHFDHERIPERVVHARGAGAPSLKADEAVVTGGDGQARKVAADFIKAIAKHRNWEREKVDQVPA